MMDDRENMMERFRNGDMSPEERRALLERSQGDPRLQRALGAEQLISMAVRNDRASLQEPSAESRTRFLAMLGAVSSELEPGGSGRIGSPSSDIGGRGLARFLPWAGAGALVVALALLLAPRLTEQDGTVPVRNPGTSTAPGAPATSPATSAPAVAPATAPAAGVPAVSGTQPQAPPDAAGPGNDTRASEAPPQQSAHRRNVRESEAARSGPVAREQHGHGTGGAKASTHSGKSVPTYQEGGNGSLPKRQPHIK
ncbi:MAG TPA: hypothetical protein VHI13_14150 [Candidatus Kapabacteria bacterium]|nr:hypothetical protein [Candidatus Kapabacteria bacterium]